MERKKNLDYPSPPPMSFIDVSSPPPSVTIRFDPQPYQRSVAIIYPAVVFSGFLISIFLNPSPGYFSSKRNALNVYFAKYGWAWTTLLYLPYAWLFSRDQSRRFYRSLARWALATIYWYILTQWFLGPSITERIFTLTGGKCNGLTDTGAALGAAAQLTRITCRLGGGIWEGGHDISGHCLLLIHSSLFLIEETWGGAAGRARNGLLERILGWALGGLLALWMWMLLVTAVYFHGHKELLSGTVFGMTFWAFQYIYFYPNFSFPGMPENFA